LWNYSTDNDARTSAFSVVAGSFVTGLLQKTHEDPGSENDGRARSNRHAKVGKIEAH
jgi:hypothetical protein